MPVGFEVKNTVTGDILVDNVYSMMALSKKQTYNSVPVGNITFTLNSPTAPLIAFNSNEYVSFDGVSISGSTWTFTLYNTVAGATITVYAFDFTDKAVTSPSNMGLQTYTDSGILLFDALGGRYLKTVNITPCSTPYTEATIATVPSGKTYATILAIASQYNVMNMAISFVDYPTAKISGSNVMASSRRIFLGAGPPSPAYSTVGSWMVVDVTGY